MRQEDISRVVELDQLRSTYFYVGFENSLNQFKIEKIRFFHVKQSNRVNFGAKSVRFELDLPFSQ